MREPRSLLDVAPVMPVISVRRAADAAPVARAIHQAGLPLIQVALDGPVALEAISRVSTEAPEVIVGAGSLTDPEQPAQARAAGAEFLFAAAANSGLTAAMRAAELPHLPAVETALQAMELIDDGYTDMVLHPAAALGGPRYLKALAAFVPTARFCPMGGITAADLTAYLDAPNVGCVGAEWLSPDAAVRRRDWDRIRRLADVAIKLGAPVDTEVRAL